MKINIVNSTPFRKFSDAVRVTILTCSPGYQSYARVDIERHTPSQGFAP